MKILFISNAGYFGFGKTLLEAAKSAKVTGTKQTGRYIAFNENKVDLVFDGSVRVRSLDNKLKSNDVHSYLTTIYGTFNIRKGKVNVEVLDIFQ